MLMHAEQCSTFKDPSAAVHIAAVGLLDVFYRSHSVRYKSQELANSQVNSHQLSIWEFRPVSLGNHKPETVLSGLSWVLQFWLVLKLPTSPSGLALLSLTLYIYMYISKEPFVKLKYVFLPALCFQRITKSLNWLHSVTHTHTHTHRPTTTREIMHIS